MALATVTVRTIEKDTTRHGGNEDKFYRTYQLPSCALFQWGSQRNGRSGGQFKLAPSPHDAVAQIGKKRNEGYLPITQHETYVQVDEAKLAQLVAQGHKAVGEFLDNLHVASGKPTGGSVPAPKPSPAAPAAEPTPAAPLREADYDRIAKVNERALAAITQAATDPAQALTEYSHLQTDLEDLEAALRKIKSYIGTLEVLVEEAL